MENIKTYENNKYSNSNERKWKKKESSVENR